MFSNTFVDDMVDIGNHPNNYNYIDILEIVFDLAVEIKSNDKFSDELLEELEGRKLEIGLCPKCGYELSKRERKEYHTELSEFGHTPYEIISYSYCEACGWSNN